MSKIDEAADFEVSDDSGSDDSKEGSDISE
jgi:hypothetical protein